MLTRAMWFSRTPSLILQVTGLYDYTFPFCSWCSGTFGLSKHFIFSVLPDIISSLGIKRITVIGGEVLLRRDIKDILEFLREYSKELIIFTKGSRPDKVKEIAESEPDLISVVTPSLNQKEYANISGGSLKHVLSTIDLLVHRYERKIKLAIPIQENIEKVSKFQESLIDAIDEYSIPIEYNHVRISSQCKNCRHITLTYNKEVTICPFIKPSNMNLKISNIKDLKGKIENLLEIKKKMDFKIKPKLKIFINFNDKEISEEELMILMVLNATKSFSGASKILSTPSTTLYYKVKKMEKKIGFKLIETSKGGKSHGGLRITMIAKHLLNFGLENYYD